MALRVKSAIEAQLTELAGLSIDVLVEQRQQRLLSYGEFEG